MRKRTELICAMIIAVAIFSCCPVGATGTPIVCIGDSITRGLHTNITYPDELGRLTGLIALNKGVPRETTTDMRARYRSSVLNKSPDYVVILGGQNDINTDVPLHITEANIHNMSINAVNNNITPILCKITPSTRHNATQNGIRTSLNNWIATYGEKRNITVVDLFTPFGVPGDPYTMNPNYTFDGTHPNDEGNKLLARVVYETAFEGSP